MTKRYSTPQYSCFTLETLVVEIVTRLASFGIDGQGYSKDKVSTQSINHHSITKITQYYNYNHLARNSNKVSHIRYGRMI